MACLVLCYIRSRRFSLRYLLHWFRLDFRFEGTHLAPTPGANLNPSERAKIGECYDQHYKRGWIPDEHFRPPQKYADTMAARGRVVGRLDFSTQAGQRI